MSRQKIIDNLKTKLRTLSECCFTVEELEILFSFLPKQEYDVRPRLLVVCALPVPLLEKVKSLVDLEIIPSASSFFRRALVSFQQQKNLPALPSLSENPKRSDYSFRLDPELLSF
jgi:hypothetical protein